MSNPAETEPIDKQIDNYLGAKRTRALEEAKMAELLHVTEDEKTGAARARKERELVEDGKINPVKGEGVNVEDIEKKVADAAEVAAEAATAGVSAEQAAELGTGKTRVVVVKPESKEEDKEGAGKGGWSVFRGKPIRDTEGDYTFTQALKIAQLEVPSPTNNNTKSLAEELADAKAKLEALGIRVGGPPPTQNRSLKDEVTEAMALLESLGLRVGTNEQAPLKEQVAEAKALLGDLGLSIGTSGESLEVIREKHQHDEKMEGLKTDKDYKERLTTIASSLPERIGRGMASQIGEGEGGSSGGSLETILCECGFRIPVTPETGEQITCPKCGSIFTKKGEIKTD